MDGQITEIHPEKEKAERENKRVLSSFVKVSIASGIVIVIAFVFFVWNTVDWFKWDKSVNSDLLGTFGDFIGGILGTIIAIYSIYMLVKTLQNQVDSNANMKITNDEIVRTNGVIIDLDTLQLFDNKFQIFFNQYKDAIASYDATGKNGRQKLEQLVEGFIKQDFSNNQDYKRKNKAAVNLYEDFYSKNRRELSIHFRLLYLLVRLLAEADIEEYDRVQYAKCVRGQLSDGEMILLRYNCQTQNGKAMRTYVNHFNLLKHIPMMSMLEFRKWKDLIKDSNERSALDSLFITLRKMMTSGLDKDEVFGMEYELSSRYKFIITYSDGFKEMTLSLEEDKHKRVGGGMKRPYAEKALDRIGALQLPPLFYAFLHESFITGNFGLYNNSSDCVKKPTIILNNADNLHFEIKVQSSIRLVLSAHQVEAVAG